MFSMFVLIWVIDIYLASIPPIADQSNILESQVLME